MERNLSVINKVNVKCPTGEISKIITFFCLFCILYRMMCVSYLRGKFPFGWTECRREGGWLWRRKSGRRRKSEARLGNLFQARLALSEISREAWKHVNGAQARHKWPSTNFIPVFCVTHFCPVLQMVSHQYRIFLLSIMLFYKIETQAYLYYQLYYIMSGSSGDASENPVT